MTSRSCTGSWECSFFFSSRRRHTRFDCDWSSDVCSSDLALEELGPRYERGLAGALDHPRRLGGALLVLAAAGFGLWHLVGTGFLPEIDEGAFVLDYFTPGGTALAETDREGGIAESILAATPEITGTSRRTGAELGV